MANPDQAPVLVSSKPQRTTRTTPALAGGLGGRIRGYGLRLRLSRIPGETPAKLMNRPMYLPAVLNGLSWTEEFPHTEYDTVSAGQFSQAPQGPAAARSLRVLDELNTLTIAWDAPWLVAQGQDPRRVRSSLYAIGRSKKPVNLLATLKTGPTPTLLRMHITFRSIGTELREGEPDTLYFRIGVSEWREATATKRDRRGDHGKLPTTHKLEEDDTLYKLSQHYYHSHDGAELIASANGIRRFGKKTPLVKYKRFKVGSKIKIPAGVEHDSSPRKVVSFAMSSR